MTKASLPPTDSKLMKTIWGQRTLLGRTRSLISRSGAQISEHPGTTPSWWTLMLRQRPHMSMNTALIQSRTWIKVLESRSLSSLTSSRWQWASIIQENSQGVEINLTLPSLSSDVVWTPISSMASHQTWKQKLVIILPTGPSSQLINKVKAALSTQRRFSFCKESVVTSSMELWRSLSRTKIQSKGWIWQLTHQL